MDNRDLKEKIIKTALVGYSENARLAAKHLKEVEYFAKILGNAGYKIGSGIEGDLGRIVFELPSVDVKETVITAFEQDIIDILKNKAKQTFAQEITDEFNRNTGKEYARKDMSSALRKMGDKKLIYGEKIKTKSNNIKILWSLPEWNDEQGIIKPEYKAEVSM